MLDSVVFNKVKEATGGQLKICLTAAAPISRETQEFISMTIAPVISAYGATETTGYVLPIPMTRHALISLVWAQSPTHEHGQLTLLERWNHASRSNS